MEVNCACSWDVSFPMAYGQTPQWTLSPTDRCWTICKQNMTASTSLSMLAYLLSVPVNELLAKAIGLLSCIRHVPSPLREAQLLQTAHPGHITGVLLTLELSLAIHDVSFITSCWPVAFPVCYFCAIWTPFRTIFSPFSLSFGSERTGFHSYLLSASCFNCFWNDWVYLLLGVWLSSLSGMLLKFAGNGLWYDILRYRCLGSGLPPPLLLGCTVLTHCLHCRIQICSLPPQVHHALAAVTCARAYSPEMV